MDCTKSYTIYSERRLVLTYRGVKQAMHKPDSPKEAKEISIGMID